MVGNFPSVYPDEILYSVLSRYHAYIPNLYTNSTLIDLFGKNTVRINTWLQGNLNLLASNLPVLCTLTPEKMIEDHSLLPVFTPFVLEERISEVKEAMINSESKSVTVIHTKLGTGARQYDSSLFYCSSCVEKDRSEIGEAYWHRVHQIPGVLVCPEHGEFLEKYYPPIKSGILNLVHLENLDLETEFNDKAELNIDTVNNLMNISKDLQWLLTSCDYHLKSYDFFYKKYRYLLKKKGLATPSGIIKGIDFLKNELVEYFGKETLEILGFGEIPEKPEEYHWLHNITRKPKSSFAPIQHVLISRLLLNGSIKHLFEEENPNTIYGNGPWYCLNSISPHYKERCITKVEVQYSIRTKKPIGIFNCEHCGFTYSLLGIPDSEEDEFKIHKIIDFGWLWKGELKKLVNQKQSLKHISERLGQGPFIIKKQADILGLKTDWQPLKLEEKQKPALEEVREKYRAEWVRTIQENREKNKSQISKLIPKTSNWLYKHDKKWFHENSPKKPTKEFIRKSHIDWNRRDLELLEKVKDLMENWNDDEKPTRKTIYRVSNKLNVTYLKKRHAEYLPLTMAYLKNEVETIDDFQLRKARITINELRDKKESLSWWKVLDTANLNPVHMSDKVKKIIAKEIEDE